MVGLFVGCVAPGRPHQPTAHPMCTCVSAKSGIPRREINQSGVATRRLLPHTAGRVIRQRCTSMPRVCTIKRIQFLHNGWEILAGSPEHGRGQTFLCQWVKVYDAEYTQAAVYTSSVILRFAREWLTPCELKHQGHHRQAP